MHLILTGATGLVGSGVLDAMIKSKDITRISILSRRPVPMADDAKDPRINVIIHKDFEKYDDELVGKLKGASAVVWALGISQSQVTKEQYIKITKDYTLAAASAFQKLPNSGEPFRFVFVSGAGTTHSHGPFTSTFARYKGETELLLADMRKANPLFRADTVRPCFVDAQTHEAIWPYIPKPTMAMNVGGKLMGPPIRACWRGLWSPTEPLGRFLTEMAMGRHEDDLTGLGIEEIGELKVVENSAIRRILKLD